MCIWWGATIAGLRAEGMAAGMGTMQLWGGTRIASLLLAQAPDGPVLFFYGKEKRANNISYRPIYIAFLFFNFLPERTLLQVDSCEIPVCLAQVPKHIIEFFGVLNTIHMAPLFSAALTKNVFTYLHLIYATYIFFQAVHCRGTHCHHLLLITLTGQFHCKDSLL